LRPSHEISWGDVGFTGKKKGNWGDAKTLCLLRGRVKKKVAVKERTSNGSEKNKERKEKRYILVHFSMAASRRTRISHQGIKPKTNGTG